MELPLRLVAADPLREGRGGVSPTTAPIYSQWVRIPEQCPSPAESSVAGPDGRPRRPERNWATTRLQRLSVSPVLLRRRDGAAATTGDHDDIFTPPSVTYWHLKINEFELRTRRRADRPGRASFSTLSPFRACPMHRKAG